tara:strand:+ start:205 stop:477 length:273 start_codon:yes stop_codon:yes gene_type:complete
MSNVIGKYAIDNQDNCYEIVAQWNDWLMVFDGSDCASIKAEYCDIVSDDVIDMAKKIAGIAKDKTGMPEGSIIRIAAIAVIEINRIREDS